MAFYENRQEHYGGALVLFQRNLSVAVPNAKPTASLPGICG